MINTAKAATTTTQPRQARGHSGHASPRPSPKLPLLPHEEGQWWRGEKQPSGSLELKLYQDCLGCEQLLGILKVSGEQALIDLACGRAVRLVMLQAARLLGARQAAGCDFPRDPQAAGEELRLAGW